MRGRQRSTWIAGVAVLWVLSVPRPSHGQGLTSGTYSGILTETVTYTYPDGSVLGTKYYSDTTTLTLELDVNAPYPPYTALLTTSDGLLDVYFPTIGYGFDSAFGSLNYATGPFIEDANFGATFLYATTGYIDTTGGFAVVDVTNIYAPPIGIGTEDFVTFQSFPPPVPGVPEPAALVQAVIGALAIGIFVAVRARRTQSSRAVDAFDARVANAGVEGTGGLGC